MILSFRKPKKPSSDVNNKHLPKIQERVEKLESYIKQAQGLSSMDETNSDEFERLHCGRQMEGLQARLNLYKLMELTQHSSITVEVEQLIDDYEKLLDNMYNSKETCGHHLLIDLQQQLTIEQDSKMRQRIGIAISICEKKILLMGINAKLIKIKITRLLDVDWLEPRVEWELEVVKRQYADYQNVDLYYSDNKFHVKFATIYTEESILAEGGCLPDENFLEDLIMLHGTYDESATDMHRMLIDMLAIVIVRNVDQKLLRHVERQKSFRELQLVL